MAGVLHRAVQRHAPELRLLVGASTPGQEQLRSRKRGCRCVGMQSWGPPVPHAAGGARTASSWKEQAWGVPHLDAGQVRTTRGDVEQVATLGVVRVHVAATVQPLLEPLGIACSHGEASSRKRVSVTGIRMPCCHACCHGCMHAAQHGSMPPPCCFSCFRCLQRRRRRGVGGGSGHICHKLQPSSPLTHTRSPWVPQALCRRSRTTIASALEHLQELTDVSHLPGIIWHCSHGARCGSHPETGRDDTTHCASSWQHWQGFQMFEMNVT